MTAISRPRRGAGDPRPASQALRPDILLVAMGVPRQELWIARNITRDHCTLPIAVGALLDFLSGAVPRAPLVDAPAAARMAVPAGRRTGPAVAPLRASAIPCSWRASLRQKLARSAEQRREQPVRPRRRRRRQARCRADADGGDRDGELCAGFRALPAAVRNHRPPRHRRGASLHPGRASRRRAVPPAGEQPPHGRRRARPAAVAGCTPSTIRSACSAAASG